MTRQFPRLIPICLVLLLQVSATLPFASQAVADDAFRPPAVPLIACDPYFSVWSQADHLYDRETTHWTGKPHRLTAMLRVDGKSYRLMGDALDSLPVMRQTSVEVLPTRTIYTFSQADMLVSLRFTTPALPEDLMILSRPTTYVTCEVRSTSAKTHHVEFYFDAGGELASNMLDQSVTGSKESFAKARALKIVVSTSERANVIWDYTTRQPVGQWFAVDYAAEGWKQGPGGFGTTETPGASVKTRWDSADIWIRRTFELESPLPENVGLRIHHDEDALVYINGKQVADLGGWTIAYDLQEIPASVLREGKNVIAIHCHQNNGGQYIDCGLDAIVPGDAR